MISIKGGTQTFSTAKQESSLKTDKAQNISADEYKKHFGDKDLGEVLNKVADPNWVDPAKMRKVGNSELGKDAFLKLLLAQLKHQDPTSPMESHQMAAQLAQFSQLEKLDGIDKGITQIAINAKPKQDFSLLNLIGKAVSGDSSKVLRTNREESHGINFDLAKNVDTVKIKIRSPLGEIVHEGDLHDIKKGKNEYTWNGMTENGQPAAEGDYQIMFEARDSFGKKVHVNTKFEGRISGVNYSSSGPVLMIGKQSVRLADVKKISDPALTQINSAPANKSVQVPKNTTTKKVVPESGKSASSPMGNMGDIAMSREVKNMVSKAGKN